mmetsp:Transcript_10427/g.25760  ORF Transcript_10427/g.25760 Transcript_10427/m.25760 type:complete len:349 (-) Transcript_10427:841-1887(-)
MFSSAIQALRHEHNLPPRVLLCPPSNLRRPLSHRAPDGGRKDRHLSQDTGANGPRRVTQGAAAAQPEETLQLPAASLTHARLGAHEPHHAPGPRSTRAEGTTFHDGPSPTATTTRPRSSARLSHLARTDDDARCNNRTHDGGTPPPHEGTPSPRRTAAPPASAGGRASELRRPPPRRADGRPRAAHGHPRGAPQRRHSSRCGQLPPAGIPPTGPSSQDTSSHGPSHTAFHRDHGPLGSIPTGCITPFALGHSLADAARPTAPAAAVVRSRPSRATGAALAHGRGGPKVWAGPLSGPGGAALAMPGRRAPWPASLRDKRSARTHSSPQHLQANRRASMHTMFPQAPTGR